MAATAHRATLAGEVRSFVGRFKMLDDPDYDPSADPRLKPTF